MENLGSMPPHNKARHRTAIPLRSITVSELDRYAVTPHPIDMLHTWAKSGEIAIPEIQRPFVWAATKVRNLLDSLYRGYPAGYLIARRKPAVKLKNGSSSAGKRGAWL